MDLQRFPIRAHWIEGAVSVQTTQAPAPSSPAGNAGKNPPAGPDCVRPWRLPHEELDLFSKPLQNRAGAAAGVRLRVRTDATALGLRRVPDPDEQGPRAVDLTIDNDLVRTEAFPANGEEVRFPRLPAGDKVVELWLPVQGATRLTAILAPSEAKLEPAADARTRWVVYGSSITQCAAAHSPARTWPALAARAADLHLTCLGFGGSCHLEPLVAQVVRRLPAGLVTLKCGINIYGAGSLSPRTFRSALLGFLDIVREGHPDTPVVVVSPILSPPREKTKNAVGFTLEDMRTELREAVAAYASVRSDATLHYVDGRELFGQDLAARCLPDDLHPNGDGYEALGANVVERVLAPLGFART